jgi:hypothetical protein
MAFIIVCDGYGAQLDTKADGSAEARYQAKKIGWYSEGGLTASVCEKDYCPDCRDDQIALRPPEQ